MPEKFQNKYRIPTVRLKTWDYGNNGMYYITICTQNRKHYFGEIRSGKMELSEIGILAEKYWKEIPKHFPFVKLVEHVVMPNHIHGIIVIDKPNNGVEYNGNVVDMTGVSDVETQNFASLPKQPKQPQQPQQPNHTKQSNQLEQPVQKNKFGPQSKNLASIIRGFKIGVTINARKIGLEFGWQPRFYDHIIRNEESYKRIKNYIINNPVKWNKDKFHN